MYYTAYWLDNSLYHLPDTVSLLLTASCRHTTTNYLPFVIYEMKIVFRNPASYCVIRTFISSSWDPKSKLARQRNEEL